MPFFDYFSWWNDSGHVDLSSSRNLVSQSLNVLPCKSGHYRDSRNIGRTTAKTVIRRGHIYECTFWQFLQIHGSQSQLSLGTWRLVEGLVKSADSTTLFELFCMGKKYMNAGKFRQ